MRLSSFAAAAAVVVARAAMASNPARELEVTAYGVNLNETQLGLVNGPDSEGKEY